MNRQMNSDEGRASSDHKELVLRDDGEGRASRDQQEEQGQRRDEGEDKKGTAAWNPNPGEGEDNKGTAASWNPKPGGHKNVSKEATMDLSLRDEVALNLALKDEAAKHQGNKTGTMITSKGPQEATKASGHAPPQTQASPPPSEKEEQDQKQPPVVGPSSSSSENAGNCQPAAAQASSENEAGATTGKDHIDRDAEDAVIGEDEVAVGIPQDSFNNSVPGAFAVEGPNLPDSNSTPNSEASNGSSTTPPEDQDLEDPPQQQSQNNLVVAAEVVPSALELENQIEQQITQQLMDELQDPTSQRFTSKILQNAPVAQVVSGPDSEDGDPDEDGHPEGSNRGSCWNKKWAALLLVGMAAIGLTVGLVFGLRRNNESPETISSDTGSSHNTGATDSNKTIMESVQSRGFVRCGVFRDDLDGFSVLNKTTGEWTGFNIDLCRVVAAAALGKPHAIEVHVIQFLEWPLVLKNRTIDVLATLIFSTMGRDVLESGSLEDFSFANPMAYTGTPFVGVPEYVDCADTLNAFDDVCRDLRICVIEGHTHIRLIAKRLPGAHLFAFETGKEAVESFVNGVCNVMPDSRTTSSYLSEFNYTGPYKIGAFLFDKQALSIPTLGNDTEWSSIVNLATQILFTAEAENLNQTNVETDLSLHKNDAYRSFVIDTIKAVGSMGSLKDQWPVHSTGMNILNTDSDRTGLIFSSSFGDLETVGEPWDGGMIDTILKRGFVRCGVTRRPGFAEYDKSGFWTGLDVEFCRALSGALFPRREVEGLELVDIWNASKRFLTLDQGNVDVLAGERVNLLNQWRELSTGKMFTYSAPYFYEGVGNDSYALMTRQDDSQWSDFVYWIVMSTFNAEEALLSHDSSNEMPIVHLFGGKLKQMFRDCIFAVGNYGDMYNRTLEALTPRSGRNTLNTGGPQQFAFPFV